MYISCGFTYFCNYTIWRQNSVRIPSIVSLKLLCNKVLHPHYLNWSCGCTLLVVMMMQLYWDCFSAKVSNLNDELHVSVFHLKLVIRTSLHWWGLTRHNYEELITMQFTLNSVLPFRNGETDSMETLDFEVYITEHGDWHWFHSSAQYRFSFVIDKLNSKSYALSFVLTGCLWITKWVPSVFTK